VEHIARDSVSSYASVPAPVFLQHAGDAVVS